MNAARHSVARAVRATEVSRRTASAVSPQDREAFECVLREKARARDDERAGRHDTAPDPLPGRDGGVAIGTAPSPARPEAPVLPGVSAPAVEPAPKAVLDAAARAQIAAPPATTIDARPDAAFDVTVNEPLGVAIEMRATRVAPTCATVAPAEWTLTIASPEIDPGQLARHANRLNERLRTRNTAPAHLRIDDHREETS